jgi:hypothetical protein
MSTMLSEIIWEISGSHSGEYVQGDQNVPVQ